MKKNGTIFNYRLIFLIIMLICIHPGFAAGTQPGRTLSLTENQDFIVTDTAREGEVVGKLRVYPMFEELHDAATFSIVDPGDAFRFTPDGSISVHRPDLLSPGTASFKAIASVPGFRDTDFNVAVEILDSALVTFVDPDHPSDGDGTRDNPRNRMPLFVDNTKVLFKRGTVLFSPTTYINGLSNILIGSYGTGAKPILETGNTFLIRIYNGCINPVVRDLEFRSPEPARSNPDPNYDNWSNAFIYASSTIGKLRVINCDIHHSHNALNDNSSGQAALNENSEIKWNHIHDVAQEGIYMQNVSGIGDVSCNKIERANLLWFYDENQQVSQGDCIQLVDVNTVHVRHNYIDKSLTGNKFNIIAEYNRYDGDEWVEITDNYLIGNRNGEGAVIYANYKRGMIARNVFVGTNGSRGVSGANSTGECSIAYNVFINMGEAVVSGPAHIYNNVFYGCDVVAINATGAMKNNIIHFTAPGQKAYNFWSWVDADHNLYNREQTGMFAGITDNLGYVRPEKESNSIVGDPLFVDAEGGDFRLRENSPAIDGGIDAGLSGDFYGTPTEGRPDIGIHELVGGVHAVARIVKGGAVVAPGEEICLSGEESGGTNDEELTHQWTVLQAPEESGDLHLISEGALFCFTTEAAGSYRVELMVSSASGNPSDAVVVDLEVQGEAAAPISADQDFVVPENAIEGEYVGNISAFPGIVFEKGLPDFTTAEQDTPFHVAPGGLITVAVPDRLVPGHLSFEVDVSYPDLPPTRITVTVRVLEASACVFVDPDSTVDGDGSRALPRNTMPSFSDNLNVLFKRGTRSSTRIAYINNLDNILIASYGTGAKPVLEALNDNVIRIYNGCADPVIRDIEFTSPPTAMDNPADNFTNLPSAFIRASNTVGSLVVINCDFNSGRNGIMNSSAPDSDSALVKWNNFSEIAYYAIYLRGIGDFAHIRYNRVRMIDPDSGAYEISHKPHGEPIAAYDVNNLIYEENYMEELID